MGAGRFLQKGAGDEPAQDYAAELEAERHRREELERRVQDLAAENRRRKAEVEESERVSRLREGLQERGVQKTRLALRLVKDDVRRSDDGQLVADYDGERVSVDDYLNRFLADNPEFLPPRITGGSGASSGSPEWTSSGFELESIRPGMSEDESKQAWKEVARLIGQGGGPV